MGLHIWIINGKFWEEDFAQTDPSQFRANDYITTPVKTFTPSTHPNGRRLEHSVYFLCLTVQID
jgi:hypothetical protein